MFRGLSVGCLMLCCLLASPALGRAQDAQTAATGNAAAAAPAQAPTPQAAQPAAAPPASARSDAAEARYRAWVEREHAQDAAAFQQGKAKIEDKYKGYVRPPREKKDPKAKSATPTKDN